MDFNCVYEANPLLPDIPTNDRIILHKILFLSPMDSLYHDNMLTYEDMIFPLILTSYVVYNNLEVIDRAKKRCHKR